MPRLRPNAPRAAWGRTVDIPVSFKEGDFLTDAGYSVGAHEMGTYVQVAGD